MLDYDANVVGMPFKNHPSVQEPLIFKTHSECTEYRREVVTAVDLNSGSLMLLNVYEGLLLHALYHVIKYIPVIGHDGSNMLYWQRSLF